MNRTLRNATFGFVATIAFCANAQAAPPNLDAVKKVEVSYHDSGRYQEDLARVARSAQAYLDHHLMGVAKPAIVFDIDETSLSNWDEIRANDFAYFPNASCTTLPSGPCGAVAWDALGHASAIAPILTLFNDAKARHVTIFFITGRHAAERPATEANLTAAGYSGWARLVMEADDQHYASATDFKAPARQAIEADGYRIIVNIGDQKSDLAGGHAERAFKLPNPFYFIP